MLKTIFCCILMAIVYAAGFGCAESDRTTSLRHDDGDDDDDTSGDSDTDRDGGSGAYNDCDPLRLAEDGPYGYVRITEKGFKIDERAGFIVLPTEDGDPAAGPFPLVVLNGSLVGAPGDYSHLYNHLVTHGFVVAGIGFPKGAFLEGWFSHEEAAEHTVRSIEWLISDDNEWQGHIDPEHIVTAGHSVGGKIGIYAAAKDAEYGTNLIDAVLAWDPLDMGGPPCSLADYQFIANSMPKVDLTTACDRWSVTPEEMPKVKASLLIFGGRTGGELSCNPEDYNHNDFWTNVPEGVEALYLVFPKVEHLDWQRNPDAWGGMFTKFVCDFSAKQEVRDELYRTAKRTNVAWLLKHTKSRSDMDDYLTLGGAAIQCDINQEIVGLVETKP
jgi:hypothetical protein